MRRGGKIGLLGCGWLLAWSGVLHAAEFSVFMTPGNRGGEGDALALREDLHVDVAGRAVPLRLKAARQSIAYPCRAGSRVELFTLEMRDGEPMRQVVAGVEVPQGAAKGVMMLAPGDGDDAPDWSARAIWWKAPELRGGRGIFVNLAGRELGLALGEKKVLLAPGKRYAFDARFPEKMEMVPQRVEVFARKSEDPRDVTRILDQSVALSKADASIFVILPKMEKYVQLLPLEASGGRDPDAERELSSQLEAIEKEAASEEAP